MISASRCCQALVAAAALIFPLETIIRADPARSSPLAGHLQRNDPAPAAPVQFADYSAALGNLGNRRTWAVSWADYDNDGWVDVFLNNHTSEGTLLRNNAGTSFSDVSVAAGVSVKRDHHNCHWADFDNDGDMDLYCTTGANKGAGSVPANLWRNDADGTFTDIAQQFDMANDRGRGRSVNWLDIDGDGDLDLFAGNRMSEAGSPASVLYRNDGAGFSEIGGPAGVALPGRVTMSSVFDYDSDGDADLLVAYQAFTQAGSPCAKCLVMLKNDGSGRFTALAGEAIGLNAKHLINTMSVGDYDNDGDNDVFVSGSGSATKHVYRNDGNGIFSSVSPSSAGLSAVLAYPIRQSILADFDNNGSLDFLFLLKDSPARNSNRLFLGQGDGSFVDATEGSGIDGAHDGLSDVAAAADFDNDGFLDVLIGNGAEHAQGPYQLFRNGGNTNRWLRVRLGPAPHATAVGSRILVTAGGNTQFREYADHSETHAFHEPVVHFGLGTAAVVDRLQVLWPDGSVTDMQGIPAGQLISLEFGGQPANRPPVVTIDAPPEGASFGEGESVDFAGKATDVEDGALTSEIEWVSSLDGLIGIGGAVEAVLSGGAHTVSASVADSGGLTGSAEVSVWVGVAGNTLPVVSIEAPLDGASFDEGATVDFAGTATDAEDGPLDEAVSWRSSRDGFIGAGSGFSSVVLSAGIHTITAEVSDSAGAMGSRSIQIDVEPVGGGGTLSLAAVADTFSNKARKGVNFGGRKVMRAHGPDEKKLGFIQFDVSALDGAVTAAVLNLYVKDVLRSGLLEVHPVQAGWSEKGLTHENKPAYGAAIAGRELSTADEGGWIGIDVTGLVQQWALSPATAFGVVLSSPKLHAVLDTRETANAPAIDVQAD